MPSVYSVGKWFGLPLLGYSGYVPFGLECLLIADLLIKQAQTANQAGVPAKI
ncbi:MAG TPA: hypothetical protein VFT72_07910 [Opitutaceae bacterium]|nr:hypothetical protein [Opitutaceae bacterium]